MKGYTYEITPSLCQSCKHYYTYTQACGYMLDTGKSRLYKDGKRLVKRGYCNTYEQGKSKSRRERFGNEII